MDILNANNNKTINFLINKLKNLLFLIDRNLVELMYVNNNIVLNIH